MKKNMFIMSLLIVTLSVFIPMKVKAYDVNDVNLSGISSLQGYNGYYALAYSQDKGRLYLLFKSNSTGAMSMMYVPTQTYPESVFYNDICASQGGCFQFLSADAFHNDYVSPGYYTSDDNGNTWTNRTEWNTDKTADIWYPILIKTTVDIYGYTSPTSTKYYSAGYEYVQSSLIDLDFTQSGSNLLVTLYDPNDELGSGKVWVSYDGESYSDIPSLIDSGSTATIPMYNYSNIYFQITDSSNNVIYDNTYNVVRTYSLSIVANSPTSYTKNLLVTLNNPSEYIGLNVMYSYNDSEYYSLGISSNGSIATLPVYTNGLVYFKILDENNNVLYTTTYNVIGMQSISGYNVYEIPSGNYNIYISNLGSSTTGYFYTIPADTSFTSSFNFLDSNGNYTGSQSVSVYNYSDLGVDTVTSDGITLVRVGYDFTNYSSTKVISFNYNKNSNLILYIPTGFYLDYVNLNNDSNYECTSDSNVSSSTNLSDCTLKFDINDNGSISSVNDSITILNNDNGNFTDLFKNSFTSFNNVLAKIGSIYTMFIYNVPRPIMYAIYVAFGLMILCLFLKIWI